jgi:hypothetical protein
VKGLPLYQPWASLVAVGAKRYETRHFPVPLSLYGKRVAIYACVGLGDPRKGGLTEEGFQTLCRRDPCAGALAGGGYRSPVDLPRGAIVCTVRVSGEEPITPRFATELQHHDFDEWCFGDYRPGRYAWVLKDLQRCDPIDYRTNHPGVFTVPDGIARQLGEVPPPGADQLTIDIEEAA